MGGRGGMVEIEGRAMRTIGRLGVSKQHLPSELFQRLIEIYAESETSGGVFAMLPMDDPKMMEMMQALEEAGLRAWDQRSELKPQQEFSLLLEAVYDDSDFNACTLLEVRPPSEAFAAGEWRRPQDPALVITKPTYSWDIIMVGRSNCYAVNDRAKRVLESANLSHLIFRRAVKKYNSARYKIDDRADLWWELRSDLLLPPVASSMTLVHMDQTPFTGDFAKGCMRKDGLYLHAELHYRASDLARVEPFDLAHTHEMFEGLPNEYDRPLVASRRFYDVCRQHNIRTGWVPVRIDP